MTHQGDTTGHRPAQRIAIAEVMEQDNPSRARQQAGETLCFPRTLQLTRSLTVASRKTASATHDEPERDR